MPEDSLKSLLVCSLSVALRPGVPWPVRIDFRLILANQRAVFVRQKHQFSALTVKYVKTTSIFT
jgi:hypothetical protein